MSSQASQASQPPDIPAHLHHDLGRAGSFKKPEMPTSACMSCNRRKLKCDREASGCSNCVKSDVTCIYPPQKRAARRKRGPYNKEKTRRERELEQSLKTLGLKSLELTDSFGTPSFSIPGTLGALPNVGALSHSFGSDPAGAIAEWASAIHGLSSHAATPSRSPEQKYVMHSGQQWPVLPPLATDPMPIPQSARYGQSMSFSPEQQHSSLLDNQSDFIFGSPTSTTSSLYALHPPASQVLEYWQIFTVNIDPVTKILHVPSFGTHIMEAKLDLQSLDVGLEALMFAVYFAAVTSLSPSECQMRFGEAKETLLARYRVAVEKALGKSNLLTSQSMMTLQALTLYLSCLRVTDTSRMTYTLTGLAIRLAKSMELHMDIPRLHVSPFENEMRKRLWWTICSLECRSAEEYGFHPTIGGQIYDCSLPLNVNDEDLDPEATEAPETRTGCTAMTWPLVRFELARIIFRIWNLSSRHDKIDMNDARNVEAEKERILDEGHRVLETQYLKFCRNSRPFDWMTATFMRLMITKLRLILHHPFNPDAVHPLPKDLREKCFHTSIEIIEQASLLRNEPRIRRWTWVFQNHHQWQALSYILSELCQRTGSELVDRAWRIVDETVANWDDKFDRIRQSVMWEPMNRLLIKARQVREQDLIARQSSYSSSGSDQTHISPNFDTWMNPSAAFHATEPLTISPSAVTTQGGVSMPGFVDPEPWFGSSVSSTDVMLPNMPTMCSDPLESGFSTPLASTAGPTRTNSDLQSLVEGLETLRPDEFAALFENYPMTY